MQKRLHLFFGFSLFFLSLIVTEPSLAKTKRTQFEPAPQPPAGFALVYMYRIKVQPSLRKVHILVDGEKTTTLSNKSYSWFYLSPGSHTIRTKWGFMAEVPELEMVINTQANAVYYVKMLGSVRNAGLNRFRTYSGIKEVSQNEALQDFGKTKKYFPALIQSVGNQSTAAPSVKQQARMARFQYAAPPKEGYSLIYFYRPKSPPALRSPKVLVDNKLYFKLSNKGYSWLYLKAGQHTVRTEWGFLGKSMNRHLKINSGNRGIYFLRFSATSGNFNVTSIRSVDGHLAKKEFLKLKTYIPATSE